MPDTPISLITYPANTNAPNVPSDMNAMTSDMDSILIPKFANATARNTAFSSPVDGNHCWLNDKHRLQVYRDSYSAWQDYTVSILKVKTASETVNNSTTLQDDDHINNIPFKANTAYFIRGFFIITSSAVADIKLQIVVSQTPQAGNWVTKISASGNNVIGLVSGYGSTQALSTQGTVDFCTVEGYLLTHASNAGTIKLQWAQNTLEASNSQLHSGSHLELVEAL